MRVVFQLYQKKSIPVLILQGKVFGSDNSYNIFLYKKCIIGPQELPSYAGKKIKQPFLLEYITNKEAMLWNALSWNIILE